MLDNVLPGGLRNGDYFIECLKEDEGPTCDENLPMFLVQRFKIIFFS